jgi:hypothetical protein
MMRLFRRIALTAIALMVAAYLVWDRIESHRLSTAIDAIAARGEPVRYQDGFPQPNTAEQREAASLYAEAAEAAQQQAAEDNHRASRLDVDKPGGAELNLAEIVSAYRDDAPALQWLDRATPLDFRGFDPDATDLLNYQYSMISLGSLACLRADLASARGDGDAAAAALVPCVRLQRTFFSEIYRSQHANRIVGSLRILFRHTSPSDAALARLQQALTAWPDEDRTMQSVLLDRARFIEFSRTRSFPGIVPAIAGIVAHPFILRSERRVIAAYDRPIAVARQPLPVRWALADESRRAALSTFAGRQPGYIARLIDPFWSVSPGLGGWAGGWSTYELAARRVAVTTIAAERYRRVHAGAAPPALDALVPAFVARVPDDPFSGMPLLYRSDADGYTIYSADSNRRDDGGTLYGFGAAPAHFVGPQSPRDFGIRVPVRPVGSRTARDD